MALRLEFPSVWLVNDSLGLSFHVGDLIDPTSPPGGQRGDIRFPRLSRSTAQWALDVEAVALRCGALDAGLNPHPGGQWFESGVPGPILDPARTRDVRACCRAGPPNWYGQLRTPPYSAENRAQQLRRLEGRGEEPSEEELGAMHWPRSAWWDDRDRIGVCPSLEPQP